MSTAYEVLVIGAGPAGLTAGIYLSRARVKTLIVDSGTPGGQMIMSHAVANYPGVLETTGAALAHIMRTQAKSFGARLMTQSAVERFDLASDPKRIHVEDEGDFSAKAVILATGGVPRTLGLESEATFKGRGVSYCATCDGDFFTGKEIVAIGGGNTALEEAVSLAQYASRVTLVHEFDHFQAEPWAVEAAQANDRIHFLLEQDILAFEGGENLQKVVVAHKKTGSVTEIPAEGCFIFIGYVPNTAIFSDMLALNARDEIVCDDNLATSLPGVFAAGDNRAKRVRQITTAVADGTVAALSAIEYLRAR